MINQMGVYKVFAFLLFIFFLIGCQQVDSLSENQQDSNGTGSSIGPADLTEETKRIVQAVGLEDVQVFDLMINMENSAVIRVWAELFEDGQKQDTLLNMGTDYIPEQEGNTDTTQIVFAYNFKEDTETNERTFEMSASIVGATGFSNTKTEIALPKLEGGRLTSPLNNEREIRAGQPITVLTLVEDDGASTSYSDREMVEYDENGIFPSELANYDRVILLRVMLEER